MLALILLLCPVFLLTSCTENKEENTTASTSDNEEMKIVCVLETYNPLPLTEHFTATDEPDFKGYELTFLNSESGYELYGFLDPDMTGQVLDDTTFERNLIAEEYFNVTISEVTKPAEEVTRHASDTILSEEDIYDVMYLPIDQLTPLISKQLFHDLIGIDELNLNMIWWDQIMIAQNIIEDRLFFATSDLNLTAMESSRCIFFNEDIITQLGLTQPYYTAVNAEWTLDIMKRYAAEAAHTRSGSEFDIEKETVYGFTTSANNITELVYGLGVSPVLRDDHGKYSFTVPNDEGYNAAWQSAAKYLELESVSVRTDSDEEIIDDFLNGKTLFLSERVGLGKLLREKNESFSFGILPMPKSDAEQESYISTFPSSVSAFCIPSTNTDAETTGTVIDYLTYMSYKEIAPRYYDISAPMKSISRRETVDILALIRGTRSCDPSLTYGWDCGLNDALSAAATEDPTSIATVFDEYKNTIEQTINATYEKYPKLNMTE